MSKDCGKTAIQCPHCTYTCKRKYDLRRHTYYKHFEVIKEATKKGSVWMENFFDIF